MDQTHLEEVAISVDHHNTIQVQAKLDLCFWHVISQFVIVEFDKILKLEIAAISALCWLSQFCTLKKKIGIGYESIRKIVNSTHTK